MKNTVRSILLLVMGSIIAVTLWAQEQLPDSPKPQNVPDPFAGVPTAPAKPAQTAPAPAPPAATNPPSTTQEQKPPVQVKTVPQGAETKELGNGPDQLGTIIRTTVNFVTVPVTVKDDNGVPIFGLVKDNFSVYENGVKQPIKFFTSDPFPISAAIVIDVGMPQVTYSKVKETYTALVGSFSEYDEVSVYTFSNTVKQQQDFNAALGDRTGTTFKKIKSVEGATGGTPTNEGPMITGPTVNGQVFNPGDPSQHHTTSVRYIDQSSVLNDAIIRATLDLAKRPAERRKVIFVISTGREFGSVGSYDDVRKVLLTNQVTLYAVAIDSSGIPGYNKLAKIRLPRQGYANILPKYANATGGEVFSEFNQEAMEAAYAKLMDQARNQYTLGYTSPATLATNYRDIEVRVNKPNLKITARAGYYPLPPTRK